MDRRTFLKAATVGTAAAAVSTVAEARPNLEPTPEAVGMLYDSTLCVGCKACVAACKEVNGRDPVIAGDEVHYDSARDLSGDTYNVIKIYKDGTAEVKDEEENGFAFEKRSCMHCVDPGCVSVCPTTSMRRDPKTGIVTHHPDVCIGCRTCTVGCPYNVPQFEYDDAFGSITKCQMCNQEGVERIDNGGMTACAEVCPTGATLFGPRDMLMEEAKRRTTLKKAIPTISLVGIFPNPKAITKRKWVLVISTMYGARKKQGVQTYFTFLTFHLKNSVCHSWKNVQRPVFLSLFNILFTAIWHFLLLHWLG